VVSPSDLLYAAIVAARPWDGATFAFSTSVSSLCGYGVAMASRGTLDRLGEPSAPAVAPRPVGRWAARVAGWGLIGACLLLAAVAYVGGERTASYEALRTAVERGDVDHVVVGSEAHGSFRGHETVVVHWRTATGWRVAQVVEQHPLRRDRINGLPVVYDVVQDLRGLDAGVEIERRPHWRELGVTTEVLGWRLAGWCALAAAGVWVGALMLLVGGPPPWRATRWAWFWLLALAAPVGVVAFLLLGGPCGLLPPAPGRRPGLRGGAAFLLALLIGTVIGTVGS